MGSVLVTNLKTGFRKGDSDRVEVYFFPTFGFLDDYYFSRSPVLSDKSPKSNVIPINVQQTIREFLLNDLYSHLC